MASAGTAFIDIAGDFSKINRGIDDTTKGAKSKFGGIGKAVAGGIAAVGAFDLLKKGIGGAVAEFDEARKVGALTDAVIKSTGGAAGVTAGHVDTLSNAISKKSGIDDEAIATGENLLLTFKNIGAKGGVFDAATQAAVDLSAAGFGSITSASKMMGKALNDPEKGISALSRAGVTFSEKQKKTIAALMATGKASDRVAAQQLILKEVQGQVGGAAAAQATPTMKLKVALGNLGETVGGVLVPAMDKAATAVTDMFAFFQEHSTLAKVLAGAIGAIGAALVVSKAITVTTTAVTVLKTAAETVAAGVTGALAGAQWLLNAAMSANPIVLVVAGLVLLGAALVVAYQKIGFFHDAVDAVFGFIKDNWPLLLAILTGPIGLAVLEIVKHWDAIKDATSAAWDAVQTAIMTPITAVAGWLSSTWTAIGAAASAAWGIFKGNIVDPVVAAGTAVKGAIGQLDEWLGAIWNTIRGGATAAWTAFKGNIVDPVVDAVSAVKGALGEEGLRGWFDSLWSTIKATAKAAWDAISGFISGPIETAASAVKDALSSVKDGGLVKWLGDLFADGGVAQTIAGKIAAPFETAFTAVKTAVNAVIKEVARAMNGVIKIVNRAITALNKVKPGHDIDLVPLFDIPAGAAGFRNFPGGLALVGEKGPELVNLPAGSDVIPNNQLAGGVRASASVASIGAGARGTSVVQHFHGDMSLANPFDLETLSARLAWKLQTG